VKRDMKISRVWERQPAAPFSGEPGQPALINPKQEAGEERVSARVIIACTGPDYQLLSRWVGANQSSRHLWGCRVRSGTWAAQPVTVAGPVLGAPYAAMVLEKLIALGAKAVLVLGWCGSLQPHVRLGSLVLPKVVRAEDGTSPHYRLGPGDLTPSPVLCRFLEEYFRQGHAAVPWHAGSVWTTDAFYRETLAAVQYYQGQGVLAVDLETAALFAVGQFRGIAVAGLLAVSDELFRLTWRPGFRSEPLLQARKAAVRAALTVLATWKEGYA